MGSWSDTPHKRVRPMDLKKEKPRAPLIKAVMLMVVLAGLAYYFTLV